MKEAIQGLAGQRTLEEKLEGHEVSNVGRRGAASIADMGQLTSYSSLAMLAVGNEFEAVVVWGGCRKGGLRRVSRLSCRCTWGLKR